jgi:Ribulose kinase
MNTKYLIGLDFGSDSLRCLIINASNGNELVSATANYPRWNLGKYCNPSENQYRQHPLDFIESMEKCVKEALTQCPDKVKENIVGIGYDTTASTPIIINKDGIALSLLPEFSEDPDAMFVLWKDHTAIKESDEINELAHNYETDYTKYSGGSYSCEWVWSKMLHCLRNNENVRSQAYSWSEHCDWIGGILTGNSTPEKMFRGRCTAGHKAMWNEEWGGLPPMKFFEQIDPLYKIFEGHLYTQTVTAGKKIGGLCKEWAERFGLKEGIAIGMGAIDCHAGAVGCGIETGTLVKVMGTSTCDIAIAPKEQVGKTIVNGICGQVDGSVLPNFIGFEAGQSAFGDIYAWFKRLGGMVIGTSRRKG